MKFLLTNDDGFGAPGLEALRQACAAWGSAVVLAPDQHLSGCSHRATTDRALVLESAGPECYRLDGTPADCTRIGLLHLAPDVDWVLSGINDGGNLGHDVHLSGTVAAVREAVWLGKPGIAVSQYRRRGQAGNWPRAALWTAQVLRRLLQMPWTAGSFWNVNLPDGDDLPEEPEIVFCPLDTNPLPVEFVAEGPGLRYRGNYQLRRRNPGSDVETCFSGRIAVTALSLC